MFAPWTLLSGMLLKNHSTLHRSVSAAVGWWVTFDPVESYLLPEWYMLCTDTIEYNPNVSKGKHMFIPAISPKSSVYDMYSCQNKTRRSENDNTPQPLDQSMDSPSIGQQVGNCNSFTSTHYVPNVSVMQAYVRPTLYPTHISFISSQSTSPFLKYGYQKKTYHLRENN